jgi:hypothetical protein
MREIKKRLLLPFLYLSRTERSRRFGFSLLSAFFKRRTARGASADSCKRPGLLFGFTF